MKKGSLRKENQDFNQESIFVEMWMLFVITKTKIISKLKLKAGWVNPAILAVLDYGIQNLLQNAVFSQL